MSGVLCSYEPELNAVNDHNADRTTCAERPHHSPKFTGRYDDVAILANNDCPR